MDARLHLDDLNAQLALDLPESDEYDTVGGYLITQLGRVPQEGEVYEMARARFTAIVATPTHVQRIGVELLQREDAGSMSL